MARRGGALSDSESDLSEDDDVSDVEDEALRRRVREAATGGRRDARLDHERFEDRAGGSAPTRAPAASAGENSAFSAAAGRGDTADGHHDTALNDGVDDEEREVLCAAVSDASAPPRHVPGINSGSIGPELAKLRSAQGEHAEYYTLEHYDRLYGRRRAWARDGRGSKVWCKDVHGPGCRECTSCHFCRQKTADVKTRCQCSEWRSTPPGGRGRGSWCGWCLEMRMGENIEEALADTEWRCPVCRDICNCSGANCLRAKRNLFPTQQLTHEALQFGWQSVAHYLITTRIRENAEGPMPMLQLPRAQREQFQRRRTQIGGGGAGGGGGGSLEARKRRAAREKEDARRKRAAALRDAVARRLGESLSMTRARVPDDAADASGDGARLNARTFRTFAARDSDEASSGSDLDSDDDDDDDDELLAPSERNGGGGVPGNADRGDISDGHGAGPNVGIPPREEVVLGPEIVVDDDGAPRRTNGVPSAAPRFSRPRDDNVVLDSQSDDDDADGRVFRRGVGGGGGGGGGDRDRDRDIRRAKRPRVHSAVGPAAAAAAAAPMEDRPLRDGSEAASDRAPEVLGSETRTAGRRRDARRRASSRRAARRADRDADREAAVLEHELSSEISAAAFENEAARALREASSLFARSERENESEDEDEDEDALYRASSRLVDCAADALAAAEAAASARAARIGIQSAARRAEGSHPDLANASSDDASSVARAEREADETLAASCALATLLSRTAFSPQKSFPFSRGTARAARRALERLVGGLNTHTEDSSESILNDASAFRARLGVRRAATLRAVLRSLEHARAASARAAAYLTLEGDAAENSAEGAAAADAKDFVVAASSVATSLLAVLGEEFCLLREHARWRARRQSGESNFSAPEFRESAPPPPLPPALAAFVGEDDAAGAEDDATGVDSSAAETLLNEEPGRSASSDDDPNAMDAAERLLTRMEECHVLLTFSLRALRRVAQASTVRVECSVVAGSGYGQTVATPRRDVVLVAPGSDAFLSETLAAFLRPRYPFRARLRKRALAVVASHATAVRRCAATESVKKSAAALDSTIWPALASLLESDHPARRDATNANDACGSPSFQGDSGCGRFVIEACARVIAGLLASKVWSWSRAEREIVAPHMNASDFWRRASAPYRALALRLYSRLCDCDASPVLSAGAGAPLLKLWVLATLDPAAAEGREKQNAIGGFGRARSRLARAVARHPVLGARFFVDQGDDSFSRGDFDGDDVGGVGGTQTYSLYSPAPVPLETRGKWARLILARLCGNDGTNGSDRNASPASLAALAAANAAWDAAPARHAEVFGTSAADRFADAIAGVSAAVITVHSAKLHATHPGVEPSGFHVAGAGVCVATASIGPRSRNASRLTAMVHVIAARHVHTTAVASSARSVASSALAAAAYAGSGRAEAAAKSLERAERLVIESTKRARDATIGLRSLFATGRRQGHLSADASLPYAPKDDPPLVGAVVALTHALWERGPPRAPTEEARDAAADAFFGDAFNSRGGLADEILGSASLASFATSAIFRGALARCVPNRVLLDDASQTSSARGGGAGTGFLMNGVTHGGHMYPPGAVAAALGTIRALKRLLSKAELNGSLPETIAGTFCVVASALLDAAHPPPPPPDPRRSAPPSGAQAAPPAVRCAAYAYFAELAKTTPGACGETDATNSTDASVSRDFGKKEYLREFWHPPPRRVVDGAVRAALNAAVTFAACEVAAASGFGGAREAATLGNGEARRTAGSSNDNGSTAVGAQSELSKSVDVNSIARSARFEARGALRGLLGAHQNSGAYDEVLRRFKPLLNPLNDAFGSQIGSLSERTTHTTTGPNNALSKNSLSLNTHRVGDGAVARDAPTGKDFDAATAALLFLRDYSSVSIDAASYVAKNAFPMLTGALSEHGAGNLRRYTRVNVKELWETVQSRLGGSFDDVIIAALPPTPPEANTNAAARRSAYGQTVTVVRSSRDALNHRTHDATHGGVSRGGLGTATDADGVTRVSSAASKERSSPWPASASAHQGFGAVASLCEKAKKGDASAKKTKLSVIGAVVSRDPVTGVKSLTNPKTKKAYDMLFLTLADHTGARCKAQLLGEKAKAAAAALDAITGSGLNAHSARVVVGLCDVSPRGGDAAAVWDPKEESVFVLRPEHPAASRL